MKLALGPLLYFWSRDDVLAFYRQARDWPVDVVYLGEAVCSKRRGVRLEDWLAIADELTAAGKEVVLSTLALIEAESELLTLRRIVDNGRFAVEANDMGAVRLAAGKVPFVAGPHLNAYNCETLGLFRDLGATRWVMPVELSRDTLAAIQACRPVGLETEVFAFGRMPLAFSARCFTARHYNLPKDDCQLRCGDFSDGLVLNSQEGEQFLSMNGIQTQSAATCNLIGVVPELKELDVEVLRLSPQSRHMDKIVSAFRAVIDGTQTPQQGIAAMQGLTRGEPCNGYWYGSAGLAWLELGEVSEARALSGG
jgi:Collagenase and related proteases